MEIQGQEKDMRGFAHLGLDSPADDDTTRGRDGNHNNNCTTQNDQDHPLQPYLLQQHQIRNISTPPIVHAGSSLKSSTPKPTRYRECLRNHAATVGGNALDGCGEFMPSGEEGTIEALKCAACDCHRNFHRKEVEGISTDHHSHRTQYMPRRSLMISPLQLPPPPLPHPQAMHPHHPNYSVVTPMNVAFGGGGCSGGGTDQSSSEELNVLHSNEAFPGSHSQPPVPFGMSKKRFRTKFTQEQKEKMMEFAEELGWKFLRQDDEKIERFCADNGLKRQVFKVWMHNNKNSAKKPQQPLDQ